MSRRIRLLAYCLIGIFVYLYIYDVPEWMMVSLKRVKFGVSY